MGVYMKVYDSKMLRNVVVLGYSGCGKINLIEIIVYIVNINKIFKLIDKVNMIYSMGLIFIEYNDYKFNLLDILGYFDFSGDVVLFFRVSDVVIIVIDVIVFI